MGRHSKEWNEGYQAAIEAIKQQMQSGSGSGSSSDLPSLPQQGDNQDGNSSSSRTDSSDSNQGIVRPEDCMSSGSSVQDCPSTPGGMISKEDGDKIAESEGYRKEGGNEGTIEKDWKDTAQKAAEKYKNKYQGTSAGDFLSHIEGLGKSQVDWKKTLKQIVGHAISPDDKRQAYANKNVLVTQNRIARTDKDKYDNLDYMMVWLDSSGSMSDEQLKLCLSEVYAVAYAKKPLKLVTVQCDTKIHEIKEYRNVQDLKKDIVHAHVKGRGGTDLWPCWQLLKNDKRYNKKQPDITIIFTDGYLTQYKRDLRSMKTLCWCILDNTGFDLKYKDAMTKVIHIKTENIN